MSHLSRPLFFSAMTSVMLLGAGCYTSVAPTQPLADSIVPEGGIRPISQHQGFGRLPAVPAPTLRPGTSGSVRLETSLPMLPPEVTVLRVSSGKPNATALRNIAGALSIPGGTIGTQPESHNLSLEWTNEDNTVWTYDASERQLIYRDPVHSNTALTVSAWPTSKMILEQTVRFMDTHGILRRLYMQPSIEPDWGSWWNDVSSSGHCMSLSSLETVRVLSSSLSLLQQGPPSLPHTLDVNCVNSEFPSRIIVQLNATQDGQAIYLKDGSFERGGTIVMNAQDQTVLSATFKLSTDPERSDYPALSANEARAALLKGGLGGTPKGDVTLTKTSFDWLRVETGDALKISYLYPVLVGQGTLKTADGSTSAYRVIVPLIK